MSSIRLEGNTIYQEVEGHHAVLGEIRIAEESPGYVLWLKDHGGIVTGAAGTYCRADEYASLEEARRLSPHSPAAFILHMVWMRQTIEADVDRIIERDWDKVLAWTDEDISKEAFRNVVQKKIRRLAQGSLEIFADRLAREGIEKLVALFFEDFN